MTPGGQLTVSRIRSQLTIWLDKKKATKREILSLVGMRLRWSDLGGPLSPECTALLPKLKNYLITLGSTKTFVQTSTGGMSLSAIGTVSVCSIALPPTTTTIIASRQMPQRHEVVQLSSSNTGFNIYSMAR